MGRFGAKRDTKVSQGIIWTIIIAAFVVWAFMYSSRSLNESNSANELDLLQTSVDRSITQCYALEGRYPSSVDYLVEHYGLTYDEDDYTIYYEYIGANLRPDVTIIAK